MIGEIIEKVKSVFKKDSCSMLGKTYPHEASACVGDQCVQCNDGKWGPNKFERISRKRTVGY